MMLPTSLATMSSRARSATAAMVIDGLQGSVTRHQGAVEDIQALLAFDPPLRSHTTSMLAPPGECQVLGIMPVVSISTSADPASFRIAGSTKPG